MDTETSSSSKLSINGSFEISFLSLFMADDTLIENQAEFRPQHQLPPLPPSSFETNASPRFISPPDQYSSLVFPTSDYFPSYDFHEVKPLKIEQQPSASGQNYLHSDFPARTLPELLSLENLTQPSSPPAPAEVLEMEANYVRQSKKRRRDPRATISGKIYSLETQLPASQHYQRRRLSTVEVLEEAHKYIRFRKAQVAALRSMPQESKCIVGGWGAGEAEPAATAAGGGELAGGTVNHGGERVVCCFR